MQVYLLPDIVMDAGREEYGLWLDQLAYCRKQSNWPGYFEGEQELTLPRWAIGFDDEEIGGLGLTSGGESLDQLSEE